MMTINRMIDLLKTEHECMLRASHDSCDRDCDDCDLVQDDGELHEMYTNVIALLEKQEAKSVEICEKLFGVHDIEDVINKLKETIDFFDDFIGKEKDEETAGNACDMSNNVGKAIVLLRKNLPIKPKVHYFCGACGNEINRLTSRYCEECGRLVKWDA